MQAESRQQVALVTGGAVRVGRAISAALARAGYRVAINYHRSREAALQLAETLVGEGLDAAAFGADVTRAEQRRGLVDEIEARFGPLDLLVNNAAVFQRRPFLELDEEIWLEHLRLNLEAPFALARLVAPGMWQRRAGRIVNVCGTVGIRPAGEYLPYCVAKSGLDMLTRCLAEALAPRVQVNGVAPGAILFPEGTPEAERRRVLERVPAGRAGSPEEVADAVLFFARAPAYVTGTILPVDGGVSAASL